MQSNLNAKTFDVAIAGGGLAGLTLGIALAQAGLATAVVDSLPPERATHSSFDGRVSAIAFASMRMLNALGFAPHMKDRSQPIHDILVTDGTVRSGASAALLHFDYREAGTEPLGHIVENRHTRLAQQMVASACDNLTLIAPAQAKRLETSPGLAILHLDDGRTIRAKLCVAADGRDSLIRKQLGIRLTQWSYGQAGIVATIEHERPHDGVAHELFLPEGPFAILPMTGNRSSIVWTESSAAAPAFLALPHMDFCKEVQKRFGDQWGRIDVKGPRWSYPLSLQLATTYVGDRCVLVGDAAHVIHPIAGQGLNLGLRDVAALAETLVEARRLGQDIGSAPVLTRYERWRRFDTVALAAAMEGFNRLFSNSIAPVAWVRRTGLDIVNRMGFAKRTFIRMAGGAGGQLPRLLKGEAL